MDMQGSRVLNATQEQAWQALNDPDILKACIPGCDKFELAEPQCLRSRRGHQDRPCCSQVHWQGEFDGHRATQFVRTAV